VSSVLATDDPKNRWYPIAVDTFRDYLYKYDLDENLYPDHNSLYSNIAYNLQYLQYLRKTLNELNLTTVIKKITIKNFILTSGSIVEGMFDAVCVQNRLCRPNSWKFENLIRRVRANNYINLDDGFYESADHIRRLRNHIHITKQISDYKKFWLAEYHGAKGAVHGLMTSNLFDPSEDEKSYFSFLIPDPNYIG